MMQSKWGVFCHYLAVYENIPGSQDVADKVSADAWNRQIDAFDVPGLASQLASVGAPYFFLTVGQNTGHYCSPNATYDKYTGISPSKCSRRDLIADLADELHRRGIRMMVYCPSNAPMFDKPACERLGWEPGAPLEEVIADAVNRDGLKTRKKGKRLAEFQVRWEAIVREWSVRWGKRVSGWWIDGCLYADTMYNHPQPPNFQSFAAALKAGNPDSLVAFAGGPPLTPVYSLTEFEDYTAGEIGSELPLNNDYTQPPLKFSMERFVNGAQFHILTFLGGAWGAGQPRFPDELVIGATKHLNSFGGVATWDVPITPKGLIPEPFVRQLATLNAAVK
ncbi:MAG: hypothetical protein IT440_03175 [Phycisphaeraceae bacterium]|nr:hypothetical protein [Phycisphaeraceae bacterium]